MTIGEIIDVSKAEGALDICIQLVKKGMLTLEQAATQLGITEEELKSRMS